MMLREWLMADLVDDIWWWWWWRWWAVNIYIKIESTLTQLLKKERSEWMNSSFMCSTFFLLFSSMFYVHALQCSTRFSVSMRHDIILIFIPQLLLYCSNLHVISRTRKNWWGKGPTKRLLWFYMIQWKHKCDDKMEDGWCGGWSMYFKKREYRRWTRMRMRIGDVDDEGKRWKWKWYIR